MARTSILASVSLIALISCPPVCNAQDTFTSNVNLVRVPCTVTDRQGKLIHNLALNDFLVIDGGRAQTVKYLWQESDLPLTVGIVVDISQSQHWLTHEHGAAVAQFIDAIIGNDDRGFIAAVSENAGLLTPIHASRKELLAGLDLLRGEHVERRGDLLGDNCRYCGGTALWHGLFHALWTGMKEPEGRKALIVLSDGWDTGSDKTLHDVVRAAEETDTVVYTIHYLPGNGPDG